MEELYYGLENLPARNPTMEEARLVQVVDHFTDITHQVCAEAGGGLVAHINAASNTGRKTSVSERICGPSSLEKLRTCFIKSPSSKGVGRERERECEVTNLTQPLN